MEFGPRALGSRSILGDARSPEMQSRMNLKIKFRESFRPFAPSVLREEASDYFELASDHDSPYMLLVAPVQQEKRLALTREQENRSGLEKRSVPRSLVPAITHVDYTARVQTVDSRRHLRYYRLLQTWKQKTDCPLVINTSFNVRGEPIVCTPQDALHCFLNTQMDVLVLENFVLYKDEQSGIPQAHAEEYLSRFELD